jgi:hypothetical protein
MKVTITKNDSKVSETTIGELIDAGKNVNFVIVGSDTLGFVDAQNRRWGYLNSSVKTFTDPSLIWGFDNCCVRYTRVKIVEITEVNFTYTEKEV